MAFTSSSTVSELSLAFLHERYHVTKSHVVDITPCALLSEPVNEFVLILSTNVEMGWRSWKAPRHVNKNTCEGVVTWHGLLVC